MLNIFVNCNDSTSTSVLLYVYCLPIGKYASILHCTGQKFSSLVLMFPIFFNTRPSGFLECETFLRPIMVNGLSFELFWGRIKVPVSMPF
jgi:hypothetical protein